MATRAPARPTCHGQSLKGCPCQWHYEPKWHTMGQVIGNAIDLESQEKGLIHHPPAELHSFVNSTLRVPTANFHSSLHPFLGYRFVSYWVEFSWHHLLDFYGVSMGLPKSFYVISIVFLWKFCQISKGCLWNFYGIPMGFPRDVYRIPMGFLWGSKTISMVFLWYFDGICMVVLWDFLDKSMIFLWDSYGMSMIFLCDF